MNNFFKENDIKEILKHDIEMEVHNYIRNIQIKEGLNILGKQYIMRKCDNFNYVKGLIGK